MCSLRNGALGNFAKFTGKSLCQSLFFSKVAGLRPVHVLYRTHLDDCFCVDIWFFSRQFFISRLSENVKNREMKFSIKDFFSKCDQIRVTFTEEIINGKFHFLCSVANLQDCRIRVRRWMCNSRKKEMKIKVLVKYKIQKRQSFIFPVYLRLLLKLGNIRKPALQFRTQSAPAIFTCWNSTIETL